MNNVTKTVNRYLGNSEGSFVEETAEALSSVELGETAPEGKGVPYVKSVKVYANTVDEAGTQALAELERQKKALGR